MPRPSLCPHAAIWEHVNAQSQVLGNAELGAPRGMVKALTLSATPPRAGGRPAGRRACARPGAGPRGRPERAARGADGHLPAGGHRPGGAGAPGLVCRVPEGRVRQFYQNHSSTRSRPCCAGCPAPAAPPGRLGARARTRGRRPARGECFRAHAAPPGSRRAPVRPPCATLKTASKRRRCSKTAAARSRVLAWSPWARARGRCGAARRAQASTTQLSSAVFHALSDLLTSGPVDYMNETNTHIISMVQLAPIAYSGTGSRRRALLAAASAGKRGGEGGPDRASGGGRAGGGRAGGSGALAGEAGEGRVGRARPWGAHGRGRRRVRHARGRRMGPQARRAAALLPDDSAQVRTRSTACEADARQCGPRVCGVGRGSLPIRFCATRDG